MSHVTQINECAEEGRGATATRNVRRNIDSNATPWPAMVNRESFMYIFHLGSVHI